MEKSEIETIYRKYFHDVFLYIRALSENESLAEGVGAFECEELRK